MRKTIRGIAIHLFRSNRLLIATTIFSIVISTMLILTMFMYATNARTNLDHTFKQTQGESDILLAYPNGSPDVLTKQIVDQVLAIPEIEQSAQVLYTSLKYDLDSRLKDMPVYTIGTTSNELTRSSYKFTTEVTPTTIAISESLADLWDVAVGDELSLEGAPLQITEIIGGPTGSIVLAVVHPDHLKPFMKLNEHTRGMMLKLQEGTKIQSVVKQLKEIDEHFRFDLQEDNEAVADAVRALFYYIIVFCVIIVVITSFLILTSFEILLYKMRNQIAILRSIGATTKQVHSIVLLQSIFINLCGVVLGALAALLGMQGIFRLAEQYFQYSAVTEKVGVIPIVAVSAICFVIFQLFLAFPVYRSTRILPLKIAEENERLDFKENKGKMPKGSLLLIIGLVVYGIGRLFAIGNDRALLIVLLGVLFTFIGSMRLIPYVIERLLTIGLRWTTAKRYRHVHLAIKNMLPQVRKNAFAVTLVSTVMMITVFGTSLLSSTEVNNHRYLHQRYETPIIVHNLIGQSSNIDPFQLKEELLALDSVKEVRFESAGRSIYILGQERPINFSIMAVQSPIVEVIAPDELVIPTDVAKKFQLKVGDTLKLGWHKLYDIVGNIIPIGSYRVGKISDVGYNRDEYALSQWSSPINEFETFQNMYIDTYDEEQAMADIASLRAQYPELEAKSLSAELELSKTQYFQIWAIFICVLIFLVSATTVGVLHALINHVLSKRKEFAVLRAIGIPPSGITQMMLTQIFIYTVTGIVLGTLIGGAVTVLLMLIDTGAIVFHFQIIGLVSMVMLLLSILTFTIVSRYLTKQSVPDELTMDGK